MKTCVLLLCVVAFLLVEVNANCPPYNNPKGPKTVKEGSVAYGKGCTKATCKNGGWGAVTCPEFLCGDGVKHSKPGNPSKNYPDCCPQPDCP